MGYRVGLMSKRLALLFVALVSIGALTAGCSSGSSTVTDQNGTEFAATVATPGVVTIDVRTPGEYAEGHIPGSLNIDVEGNTFDEQIATLDKGTTYAIYCRSGRRSAIAAEKLADAGFTSLFNLDAGVPDWPGELVSGSS
jgi:phage shock protein E